jgi:KUP system potassium uptake protein
LEKNVAVPAVDAVHRDTTLIALAVSAIGIVFGDIGTSPLYTLKECFHQLNKSEGALARADVLGVLSLVFWSLMLVVTMKYLMFVMRADNRGEGGIFALLALAPDRARSSGRARVTGLALLAIVGAALLYGDGMITPAISVLSAVEGIAVTNPALNAWVIPLTCGILFALFSIQSRGTGAVAKLFGPIMLIWFGVIGALGLYHLAQNPSVVSAVSPHHAVDYLSRHGWRGATILGSVFLAVTGGEALYADMGHFGVKPIRVAWMAAVLPSLLFNYFGQGALVLADAGAHTNPFFAMAPAGLPTLLLVILSSAAAVIASQALISGSFSLTRQAIQLGYLPRLRVRHTAHEVEGQIYIPEVNLLLAAGSLLLVVLFGTSSNLAAAYGIAVTGTMAVTSVLFYIITRDVWHWPMWKAVSLLLLFLTFDLAFLLANLTKFTSGGYVPVLIAVIGGAVMLIWKRGRAIMDAKNQRNLASATRIEREIAERLLARVPGTAVFLSSRATRVPPILAHYVRRIRSLHETLVLLTVRFSNVPTVPDAERYSADRDFAGTWRVTLRFGFMEDPKVVPALEKACAAHSIPFERREAVYLLGRENLLASDKGLMPAWEERIFAFLHRNTATPDSFFGLPHQQVIELGTQMDL